MITLFEYRALTIDLAVGNNAPVTDSEQEVEEMCILEVYCHRIVSKRVLSGTQFPGILS